MKDVTQFMKGLMQDADVPMHMTGMFGRFYPCTEWCSIGESPRRNNVELPECRDRHSS